MQFFGVPVRSFNLEITNRCTLACPECARTGNPWIRANRAELPVSLLEEVFPIAERDRFEGLKINMCGAYGDCIYHTRFHDVVRHLKSAGLQVMIETNGSYRNLKWWAKTCELLGDGDEITFSVDGLEDTNHIYRINSRWSDIVAAMGYCAPRVPVSWKFVVFRHNEHQVEEAKELAKTLGVRDITFKKSARFKEEDPLAPQNDEYIGVVSRNRMAIRRLQANDVSVEEFDRQVAIRQKCLSGRSLAITALGYLYPCTSCETSDMTTWFSRNREHFDLRRHTIQAILASPKWLELHELWRKASTAPSACLGYCGVHGDFDRRYDEAAKGGRPNKPEDVIRVEVSR